MVEDSQCYLAAVGNSCDWQTHQAVLSCQHIHRVLCVVLQLTYHTFGSQELKAAIDNAKRPGRQSSHQVDPQDSEAIRFLKGGVLYVHLIKAIDVADKPKYKGGFLATRL